MDIIRRLRSAWRNFRRPRPTEDQRTRDLAAENRVLRERLSEVRPEDQRALREAEEWRERRHEMLEALAMGGAGPWRPTMAPDVVESFAAGADGSARRLREANPLIAQGAFGDLELALSNVEWRREVNLSWLEFSRWGIQQIILISRLYYIKNPIIRRLIDVCAAYVFARGVEISSPDKAANEVLSDFIADNKTVLGQGALCDLERRKDYDGNLFFAFFPDKMATGKVTVRTIDATEIQDIVTDPEDQETSWLFRRLWTQRDFDQATGQVAMRTAERWYPALYYDPPVKPEKINGVEVAWDTPVYHRRCGHVAQWRFGCPRIYPALDWSKAARKFLEACATVRQALASIAMTITTKGGQQAMMGLKQQLQTNVNAAPGGNSLWDTNPPPVAASIFASGPGTTLEPFRTAGAGGDPEEVRQFKLQCCMVKGVPETFLSDVSTGNLATATSLDRPTETAMLELQEAWVEDLSVIGRYVLEVSLGAANGKLREALQRKKIDPASVTIQEMARRRGPGGRLEYFPLREASIGGRTKIEVRVQFPAIREGDIPALVNATVAAMTLANRGGQTVGIDEKEGVRHLMDLLGFEDTDQVVEAMYPDGDYDPNRAHQVVSAPVPKLQPAPAGTPQQDLEKPGTDPQDMAEAAGLMARAAEAMRRKRTNGHA